MSMKYELSLWRDYPAATTMKEQKTDIVAATGMDYAGRAQNIVLTRTYTGKDTLEFDLPVRYFDIMSGEDVPNPLLSKIVNKSKLKLWRDERWWNPFATYVGTGDDGCEKYEGAWIQGRWYDFIVNSKKEKRSKRKLMYSFKCDALFVNELSRTGYSLQFVPDTDLMSANGMGTAHDLARRIVDGTDWQYVKTEVFPDYKEEFNAVSGETIKVPKATDQIEWLGGLERYGYCYKLRVDATTKQEEIVNDIVKQLPEAKGKVGFENNYFYWENKEVRKDYVYGYTKTNIITSYADPVLAQHSGEMTTTIYKNDELTSQKMDGTLFNNLGLWEGIDGTQLSYVNNIVNTDDGNINYYTLIINGPVKYLGHEDTTIEAGERFAVRIKASENIKFGIFDGNDDIESKTPIVWFDMEKDDNVNVFYNTYWFVSPKRISRPVFVISPNTIDTDATTEIKGVFIYKLLGATEEYEEKFTTALANSPQLNGKMTELSSIGSRLELESNWDDTAKSYIWLPCNTIAQNAFKEGTDVYLCEFDLGADGYKQVYLPKGDYTKISNYNVDKRRAISGEKSNRYSLLETVSKTFYCFTKFMVDHDENGYIRTDSAGRPKKYFTFVSELGRNQFHGFTYEVNLNEIERTVDSENLVTKCWVEAIENEHEETNSGMVTIQNSVFNKFGESFIYNFEYFLHQGLVDKESFLKDYRDMTEYVGQRNWEIQRLLEVYTPNITMRNNAQVAIETSEMLLSSYKDAVNKILDLIGWENLKANQQKVTGQEYNETFFNFPQINYTKFPSYNSTTVYYDKYNPNEDFGSFGIPEKFSDIKTLALYMAFNLTEGGNIENAEADENRLIGRGMSADSIEDNLEKIIKYQTSYKEQQINIITQQANLDKANQALADYETTRDRLINEKNKKIEWFEKRYTRFIIEGQWPGGDYIEADTFYLDATRAVASSAMPKVTYSMNVIDLSKLCNPFDPTDETWGQEFIYDVGDTTIVKDTELFPPVDGKPIEQKAMVATLKSYIDVNKPDDIELRNFETRFEELFQTIAAAVTQLQLNEDIYGRAANFTSQGTIDETILQKSFNENKNLVISSANNKVSQDNRGITIKDIDNTGKVLRAIAGGIFLSNDGGNTFTAGLTADGMNASLITAGQLDTSKVVIRNTDTPQYVLDTQGLTAYSTDEQEVANNVKVKDNKFVRFDQFGVYMTEQGQYFGKDWWKGYAKPTEHISDNSIFSLTKQGLNINSQGANGGSIQIRTEDSTILSLDKNKNPRVRLGYIRTETEDNTIKDIHGIDIYDGAFRIYGMSYEEGLTNEKASLWFEDDSLYLKGVMKGINPIYYIKDDAPTTTNYNDGNLYEITVQQRKPTMEEFSRLRIYIDNQGKYASTVSLDEVYYKYYHNIPAFYSRYEINGVNGGIFFSQYLDDTEEFKIGHAGLNYYGIEMPFINLEHIITKYIDHPAMRTFYDSIGGYLIGPWHLDALGENKEVNLFGAETTIIANNFNYNNDFENKSYNDLKSQEFRADFTGENINWGGGFRWKPCRNDSKTDEIIANIRSFSLAGDFSGFEVRGTIESMMLSNTRSGNSNTYKLYEQRERKFYISFSHGGWFYLIEPHIDDKY